MRNITDNNISIRHHPHHVAAFHHRHGADIMFLHQLSDLNQVRFGTYISHVVCHNFFNSQQTTPFFSSLLSPWLKKSCMYSWLVAHSVEIGRASCRERV